MAKKGRIRELETRIAELESALQRCESEKQGEYERGFHDGWNALTQHVARFENLMWGQVELEARLSAINTTVTDNPKSLPINLLRDLNIQMGEQLSLVELLDGEFHMPLQLERYIDLSPAIDIREAIKALVSNQRGAENKLRALVNSSPIRRTHANYMNTLKSRRRSRGETKQFIYERTTEYLNSGKFTEAQKATEQAATDLDQEQGVKVEFSTARAYYYEEIKKRAIIPRVVDN